MTCPLCCHLRSWESTAKSGGIPVRVISDGLGHDSELTTLIYLSTTATDRANATIMRLLR
ncbi:MAG: integrase [Bacteroidales bacterium]|nr:integrase [Bacteroidales bacterium]MCM1146624.1 integrase [Bacteroidales bacterium]MCM1206016.1 integrase [Bacillota bacterium]MCM1511490.1 hypothetical protein [Clostridium sp.]